MKASDRGILLGVGVFVLVIAFYLMVLSPKRQEAAKLGDDISELKDSISQGEQTVDFGEQARKDFPRYYGRLVVLGKAVPEQADTPSMLVQLNSVASSSKVQFRGLELTQGAAGAGTGTSATPAAAAPATPSAAAPAGTSTTAATPTPAAPTSGSSTPAATSTPAAAPATTAPVPATEADAANLPIGAVVGPSGLPTLPYNLTFTGGFFDVANFMGGVDDLVRLNEDTGQVAANGRLFTVDGFALEGGQPGSSPTLDAKFLVTSYVTGASGLTAGASPTGPAAASAQPATTPASTGTATP